MGLVELLYMKLANAMIEQFVWGLAWGLLRSLAE